MTIILGKVLLRCPETGEEVTLHNKCMNIDGKGTNCKHFKHFCIQGNKVWVACSSEKDPRGLSHDEE